MTKPKARLGNVIRSASFEAFLSVALHCFGNFALDTEPVRCSGATLNGWTPELSGALFDVGFVAVTSPDEAEGRIKLAREVWGIVLPADYCELASTQPFFHRNRGAFAPIRPDLKFHWPGGIGKIGFRSIVCRRSSMGCRAALYAA